MVSLHGIYMSRNFFRPFWRQFYYKPVTNRSFSRVSKNQYGLIKTRNIQDCLAWSFEYIHMCHKSKREIIIFKIDFVKAFDKVNYNAILFMMKHLGFSDKWIRWVNKILSTATTSVILNGVPGKNIHCKCGVRQGDPFSPL